MRLRRLLIVALMVGLGLGAALAGAGAWLLTSKSGLALVFRLASESVPGKLQVTQVQGRLRGPIILIGVSYRSRDQEIHLQRLSLAWRPEALLSATLHVTRLDVRGLTITRLRPAATGSPAPIPPLPLVVRVDDAEFTGLRYTPAPGKAPVILESLHLAATLTPLAIHLSRLDVRAPQGTLEASGTIRPSSNYRLGLKLRWRLALADQPALAGSGTLGGDLARLEVRQRLSEPEAVAVRAVVQSPFAEPRWSVDLHAAGLDLSPWLPKTQLKLIDATVSARGQAATYTGSAHATATVPPLGRVSAKADFHGSLREVDLKRLVLAVAGTPMRAQLDAHVDLASRPVRASVDGSWSGLRWPVTGPPRLTSDEGQLHLSGSLGAYRLALQGLVAIPQGELGRWELTGQGDSHGLQLSTITGRLASAQIRGKAELSWQAGLRWQIEAQAQGLDPAALFPGWPGRLQASVRGNGEASPGGALSRIELRSLSGTLRGHSLQASATVTLTPSELAIDRARLRSGDASAVLDGHLGKRWDLRWSVNAPQLQALLADARGSLSAHGTVEGSPGTPRVSGNATVHHARVAGYEAGSASVEVSADLAPGGRIAVRIEARALAHAGITLDSARLNIQGTAESHSLELTLTAPGTSVQLRLHGGYRPVQWSGELIRAQVVSTGYGTWALERRGPFFLSRTRLQVGEWCWQQTGQGQEAGRLCLGGQWQRAGAWQVGGLIKGFPLALLNPLLPGGATLKGQLEGTWQFGGRDGQGAQGEGRLTLSPGALTPGAAAARTGPLAYRGGTATVKLTGDGLEGGLELSLADGGRVQGEIRLPGRDPHRWTTRTQPIAGQLSLSLPDLKLLASFVPGLAVGPGGAQAALTLGGTLGQPEVNGTASLHADSVDVATAGIRVTALRVVGVSHDGRTWQLSGGARSGPGQITLEGTTALDPAAGWPTRLKIKGERFEAVKLREYEALVSPDLEIVLTSKRIEVNGEIQVPEARLRPRGGGTEVTTASPDVVIVRGGAQPGRVQRALYAHIKLVVGKKVQVAAFGLSATIAGQVLIEDTPDSFVKGNGELRVVQGQYKTYGQDLQIQSGRLMFAGGPIDDPGIEARAVRQAGSVTAGVQLRGTLRDPQVTLFSDPALSQADILSYLVLGVPVSSAGPSKGSPLFATAAALGFVADSPMVRQLRQGLGLEELRFESDTTRESVAVVLGRYLSPRLYVGYSVGLTQSESAFRIRYQLSKHWSLETSTGTASGADIKYSIEK